MKVLITSDSYLPRLGGAEVYAYQLATFLKREGHSVEILTPEMGSWVKDAENPTHRIAWSRNPVRLFQFLVRYYKLVRKADIVHSIYSHKLAAIAGVFCLFSKAKLVVSLQGRGILDLPGNRGIYSLMHVTYRRVSLKLAYKVIASCREFVDIASRYTKKDKIVYLPNLVDIDEFQIANPNYQLLPFEYKGEHLIFTIRRLVPKNGVQFAVEAMPKILEKDPDARLVMIGWGPLETHLQERAKALGVEDKIFMTGRVENFELRNLLQLADVVLFPSTAESTSIACLESMSLGKPIVASKVGGYPEMVEEDGNGYLVDITENESSDYAAPMTVAPEKLELIAEAVAKITLDKKLQERLGTRSRQLAEKKFSWQENVGTIISHY